MSLTTEISTALAQGKLKIVDLTNSLSADTPSLRLPEPFANLIDFSLEEVSAYDEPGPFWKHHNIHTGEHIGTHIDAPIHWASGRNGKDVSQIAPARLIGPAAVLDVSAEVEENPDFLLEVKHLKVWETQHGALPSNGWLLLRTGWDKYADDKDSFLNTNETGSHTPGISPACAKWLAEETLLSGYGVETVGIDQGNAAQLDPPFPAHYFLLGNDKYGITSLQNLALLPATGAVIVIAPLPVVGGDRQSCANLCAS